jgi:hypothetical protein
VSHHTQPYSTSSNLQRKRPQRHKALTRTQRLQDLVRLNSHKVRESFREEELGTAEERGDTAGGEQRCQRVGVHGSIEAKTRLWGSQAGLFLHTLESFIAICVVIYKVEEKDLKRQIF